MDQTFDYRQWQETDHSVQGFPGVKAADRESDEASSFSAEVKHEWRSTSTSPYAITERY